MVIVLFTLLFMDMFDTIGTLVGVATKANMLDKDGKVPNIKKALFADAIGTTMGACLGTSTVSTFVESASGVAEGGRTGLTAVSTAFMFFLSLFLSPIFGVITSAVTASVLVIVGLFMIENIKELNLKDDYKYKQDNLVMAFDYLNKAMNSYNDYVYMQGHRRNSFDTSYRDCIDSYNNYLSKSQAYYSLFKD